MMSDMQIQQNERPKWALVVGAVAVLFGLMTIFSGGRVLFGHEAVSTEAGKVVAAIVWFNFLSGFAYVLAGIELMRWRRRGALFAMCLFAALILAGIYLIIHIAAGGAFEMRTVAAMVLRLTFWGVTAVTACRAFDCFNKSLLPNIR